MDPDDVDPLALARMRDLGGPELATKLFSLFESYIGPKVAEATAAVQRGDWATVQAATHPVKSSAGHMGARRLRAIALQMEELAAAREPDRLPELAGELESAFHDAHAALAGQLKALGLTPGGAASVKPERPPTA